MEPKFKVGQTVYLLKPIRYYSTTTTRVVKAKVKRRYRNFIWQAQVDVGLLVEISHTEIGKTVFLSKKEADKAYEEYKREELAKKFVSSENADNSSPDMKGFVDITSMKKGE